MSYVACSTIRMCLVDSIVESIWASAVVSPLVSSVVAMVNNSVYAISVAGDWPMTQTMVQAKSVTVVQQAKVTG